MILQEKSIIHTVYTILLAALFYSCKTIQPYQQPGVVTGSLFRDADTSTANALAGIGWKELFTDTLLQQYLETGIVQNNDLKIAFARIEEARAAWGQSKAAFSPELNAGLGVGKTKYSLAQTFGTPISNDFNQYEVGLSAKWEADLWGKLKATRKAAWAQLLQTEAMAQAVQTRLIADIAATYYQLQALDHQLSILEKTILNRREDVATMKALMASNRVNNAAVVQSEANLLTAEISVPSLQRQIRETENTLSILLGKAPGQIKRNIANNQEELPVTLQTGVPSQLLQNRPDLRAAELEFRSAFEYTNVARANFYPSLNITASSGFSAFDLSKLFSAAGFFYSVTSGLMQPVLNKGLNKARLKTAQARQQQALYAFQQNLLVAGKEVSDALYLYHTAKQKSLKRVQQLSALNKSVEYTKELLKYSSATNYTDVLTAEQGLLAAELESIADKLEQRLAIIELYRSLGGGVR